MEIAPETNLDIDSRGRPIYLEIIGAREKFGAKATREILVSTLPQP